MIGSFLCISLDVVLSSGDDVFLHCGSHIYEVSGEACDTDNQVVVLVGILLSLSQGSSVNNVVLNFHTALGAVRRSAFCRPVMAQRRDAAAINLGVAGSAGITLYTVGAVKTIPDIRTYVSIDGGMGDNPRYILYQSTYELVCANKADKPKDFKITLAGRCCESGDLIQEHTKIQTPEVGDTLAVLTTGAYNYSMASNYNRIPRPAAVMIKDGEARVIIERETFEDLCKNDV